MNQEHTVYPRRWAVLLVYMGVGASMQCLWATFFSVTTQAWHYYGFTDRVAGETAMSNLSIIIMAGMVILSIPASAVFAKIGWHKSVALASVLMAVCAVIRGFVGANYSAVVACTVGMSAAQPFILNAFSMLAAKWFSPEERGIANGLGMSTVTIGVMFAQFGFPWLQKTFGMDIPQVLKVYGFSVALLTILYLIVARDHPPVPPCDEELTERIDYVDGIKHLIKNKYFIFAMLIYFALNGSVVAFTTLIEPIINYLNNNSVDSMFIGTMGTIISLTSLVATIVITGLTDRMKEHRRLPSIRICLVIGTLGAALYLLGHSTALLLIASAVYGFFYNGIMSVAVVYGCEAGFPVSEGTTESLLQWIGNIGSMMIVAIVNAAFSGNHLMSLMFIFGIMLFSIFLSFVTKEKSEKERMLKSDVNS